MTLPVSSYEALLVQVRELTHETILLQRQLTADLYNRVESTDVNHNQTNYHKDYELGRLLYDNLIRRCDRKIEFDQRRLIDQNDFTFHPPLAPAFDRVVESFSSGELTARLIAWKNKNRQQQTGASEEERFRNSKPSFAAINPETAECIPSIARVGVEGGGTSLLYPWDTAVPPPQSSGNTREGLTIGRPYDTSGDPPLSRDKVIATEQLQSASTIRVCPTSDSRVPIKPNEITRESSFRGRCQYEKPNYRNQRVAPHHHKGHDMDTTNARGDNNIPNSDTPSPEPCARTVCYNEDGSSDEDSKHDNESRAYRLSSLYHDTWPIKRDIWTNDRTSLPAPTAGSIGSQQNDMTSVMSFSSSTGMSGSSTGMCGHRRLGAKVDVVYSLLGMLGSTEGREDMSATLLAMSNSIDSCLVMRQSGCLPLLVQLIHAPGQDDDTRERASRALHNVINARSDEKVGRREARVLRLLEQIRDYCQALRASIETVRPPDDLERHPGPTIAALMKLSFDEAHRHAMCQLGGLHAISELIEMDHASHGSDSEDPSCVTLRRYAGMALTNLTFGDGNNKALLCSFRAFMKALVSQLRSLSDDLRQVTASVLRNLSWRADSSSKQTLREVGAVTGLMKAAMEGRKESTLKSILSALWNLSAHCSTNKVDICAVEGALAFLVDMLSYKAPSKTLSIVENAGGILRNVSSHIAVREDYRGIIRERDCLQVLLQQLRSPSLTVVSNACGALWNLSARCPHDQRLLWDLGAVPMLRSLVHSKHKMISMGSSAALKNLLSARPAGSNLVHLDSTARGLGLPTLPTLVARRQRALEQEIDQNLAETCDNIEPSTSPINKDDKYSFKLDRSFVDVNGRGRMYHGNGNQTISTRSKYNTAVPRSESRESMRSITSTHSDTLFERVSRHVTNDLTANDLQVKQQSSSLHSAVAFGDNTGYAPTIPSRTNNAEKKYALRYKSCIPERSGNVESGRREIDDLACTTSTMSWATGPDRESACSQILVNSSIEESLGSITSSKSSIKRPDDLSIRHTRINYQNSSLRLPVGKTNCTEKTLSLVESPTLPKAKTPERQIRTTALERNSNAGSFEIYAETDVDQPTNYGLRYAEQNSDEDEKPSLLDIPETENDVNNTVENYHVEGTSYRTLMPAADASTNNASDFQSAQPISRMIHSRTVDDVVTRDIQREKLSQRKSMSDANEQNTNTPLRSSANRNASMLANSSHCGSSVMESSESLANCDNFIAERFQTSPCHSRSSASGFDVDSVSSIDTADTRINYLLLNDEAKMSNASAPADSDLPVISNHEESSEGENICNPVTSDGDDDDEDLLAACIHNGMQNNRHRHAFRRNSLKKTPPSESNLARYQTSLALNQVEINNHVERNSNSSRSNSPSNFNIEIATVSPTENNQGESSIASVNYATFEDNLNVAKDDDKISVEYQKLSEYSCDRDEEANYDNVNKIVENFMDFDDSATLEKITDPVEGNETRDVNDIAAQSDSSSNRENHDSESMESSDSVERSEQALLQLCIKSNSSKAHNAPMNESNSILSNMTKIDDFNEDRRDVEIEDNVKVTSNDECKVKNEDEYRRRRDPDAMIASLDRLTATLVQQTEAMRERESSAMKQSVLSDTWAEDSPNEVSYPSISVSAPFIASFKSDTDEDHQATEPTISTSTRDCEKLESSCMTNSRIIEREAIRLAEAVSAEATRQRMNYGSAGMTLSDLETTGQPASMENEKVSLASSYTEPRQNSDPTLERCRFNSLSPFRVKGHRSIENRDARKKSLPLGVMAKRALGHGAQNAGSLESLLNDCSLGPYSQLENVMPPSLMDEIFDNGDMENSMLSVASITSEIAESKEQDSDNVFDRSNVKVLSMNSVNNAVPTNASTNDSTSEYLENINPPSLLNEISDMDDSTIDANTDTMCSETLCVDTDITSDEISRGIVGERIEESENDTDDTGTPITTDTCYTSSAESTPKKRSHKSHLTPKQRRQLAKERFKTYTIAAELVQKEENERRKHENNEPQVLCKITDKSSTFSKLTPKQRRQEDPARFQTQVLTNPFPDFANRPQMITQEDRCESTKVIEAESPVRHLDNLCGGRTFRKKRPDHTEDPDRYRTRTLGDVDATLISDVKEDNIFIDDATRENIVVDDVEDTSCDAMQTMLEQNANIVLHTLNETSKIIDGNIDDLLDCETLSLVSNDSESEHSLRMRMASELGKKLMTSCLQRANRRALTSRQDEEPMIVVENDTKPSNAAWTDERESDQRASDSENEDEGSRNDEEQPRETIRPRIVKPGTVVRRDRSVDSQLADKSEPASPKGIRGRRKALYSTPNTRRTTPQSSPIKHANNPTTGIPIGRSNTSPVVRSTRATTLRQNTNVSLNAVKDSARTNFGVKNPQSSNIDKRSRNSALSKRSSIPQRGTTNYATTKFVKRLSTPSGFASSQKDVKVDVTGIKPLERQGTFTKDEPEIENAPTVGSCSSPVKSKIAKPTRGSPVRSNPTAVKSKIFVKTHENQNPRISSSSTAAGKKIATVEPAFSIGKCQIDQGNAQTTENTKTATTTRRFASLGQRSSSNSSIVSSPSTPIPSRKLPKEATSKIASLWKKVEVSRAKQRFEKPDARQWITATPTDAADSQKIVNKPPAFRLFRSSTFEGVPQETNDIAIADETINSTRIMETREKTSKYRNSCDLTGMPQTDAPCKIPVKFTDRRIAGKDTPIGCGTIVLRKQRSIESAAATAAADIDCTKRISRLGSFISVDASKNETRDQNRTSENTVRTPISAIVPPFNYNPRQEVSSLTTRTRLDDDNDDIRDFQSKIITSSAKVTSV